MIHEWMAVVRVDKPFLLRGGWRRGTYVLRGPKNVQTSGEGAHRICASGSRKAAGCRRRKGLPRTGLLPESAKTSMQVCSTSVTAWCF